MALAFRLLVFSLLAFMLPLGARAQTAGQVQDGCDLYSQARFGEAISTLERALLQGSLTADERLAARICLARSYVKAGDAEGAREVFKSILRIDPTWIPDEFEVPPDEIAVFEAARAEMEPSGGGPAPDIPEEGPQPEVVPPTPTPTPESEAEISEDDGGKPWWLWPLVGVVAVGGAIVALAGGGGDEDDGGGGGDGTLPEFPDPPTKMEPAPQ